MPRTLPQIPELIPRSDEFVICPHSCTLRRIAFDAFPSSRLEKDEKGCLVKRPLFSPQIYPNVVAVLDNLPVNVDDAPFFVGMANLKKASVIVHVESKSNVTMFKWFNGCTRLEQIEVRGGVNVTSLVEMRGCFNNCQRVVSINFDPRILLNIQSVVDSYNNFGTPELAHCPTASLFFNCMRRTETVNNSFNNVAGMRSWTAPAIACIYGRCFVMTFVRSLTLHYFFPYHQNQNISFVTDQEIDTVFSLNGGKIQVNGVHTLLTDIFKFSPATVKDDNDDHGHDDDDDDHDEDNDDEHQQLDCPATVPKQVVIDDNRNNDDEEQQQLNDDHDSDDIVPILKRNQPVAPPLTPAIRTREPSVETEQPKPVQRLPKTFFPSSDDESN